MSLLARTSKDLATSYGGVLRNSEITENNLGINYAENEENYSVYSTVIYETDLEIRCKECIAEMQWA